MGKIGKITEDKIKRFHSCQDRYHGADWFRLIENFGEEAETEIIKLLEKCITDIPPIYHHNKITERQQIVNHQLQNLKALRGKQ